MAGLSQRKLDDLRREWQNRLKLRDWKIKIQIVDLALLKDLTKTDWPVGGCETFPEAKEARIYILRQEDWGDDTRERAANVEDTIVHELLHIHFAPFEASEPGMMLHQEQAIEALTAAFLSLKRGTGSGGGKRTKAGE